MNLLDKQYQDLLQDILDNGHVKGDRTGTGTKSVFGRVIRHNMKDGFPLLTTKKMFTKGIITELLWFLRGETNIQSLVKDGNNIWVGDCYKKYCAYPLATIQDHHTNILYQNIDKRWCKRNGRSMVSPHPTRHLTKEEFIEKIKTDDEFAKIFGELGPCYGSQWRRWGSEMKSIRIQKEGKFPESQFQKVGGIDQIQNMLDTLKTNPDSRRIMVNAWNVSEIDEMVLPPCHYGFQVWTRELSEDERHVRFPELKAAYDEKNKCVRRQDYQGAGEARDIEKTLCASLPKREISLSWNQRSVDTFLGLPFNIASYGFLLEMIAKEVNMVPGELIGYLGDTHLYLNHLEQAKEQIGRDYTPEERYNEWFRLNYETGMERNFNPDSLPDYDDPYYTQTPKRTREPFPLPIFDFVGPEWDFDKLSYSNFQISNYKHHEKIAAPLSN